MGFKTAWLSLSLLLRGMNHFAQQANLTTIKEIERNITSCFYA